MNLLNGTRQVFVCGAGHQGFAMAAHLSLNGLNIGLWNRTPENIQEILETGIIHCSGLLNGDAQISKASPNISDVISDFVMVATPSTAHKDIAKIIAPYVNPDMVIILNPGRTFGAIEFAEELKKLGVTHLPHIAETQTILYTCRKTGPSECNILAIKKNVQIAAIRNSDINYIMDRMPDCIKPYFQAVNSVVLTSLSNIGMVLHCAPVIMNIGWIENPNIDFKYYYDGISPSIANFLEKIDVERQTVARAVGYNVISLKEWLENTYSITGNTLFECIKNNEAYKKIYAPPTLNTRYIFEDVPNGLVPVEAMGKEFCIPTPNITTIIDLASSIMNTDYREIGRRFSSEKLTEYF